MALMCGDIMTVFPVFQAFWITLGVAGGVAFYPQQTIGFHGTIALFVIATILMACGVVSTCQHGYKHRANGGRATSTQVPAPDGATMGDGGGIELQDVQTTTAARDGTVDRGRTPSTSREKLVSGQGDSQSNLDIVTEDGTDDVVTAALGFNPAYSTRALSGEHGSFSPSQLRASSAATNHERRQTMENLEARIQGLERETQFYVRGGGPA